MWRGAEVVGGAVAVRNEALRRRVLLAASLLLLLVAPELQIFEMQKWGCKSRVNLEISSKSCPVRVQTSAAG